MPRIITKHNDYDYGQPEDTLNNVKYLVYEYRRPIQNFYKLNDS